MGILINVAVSSAVGVTTYLVAPAVGGAALGLLGFKAGGIAAGSAGASMMSASAAASGGGVASGGKSNQCTQHQVSLLSTDLFSRSTRS